MEKELQLEELFCGMPALLEYFQETKKTLRYFHLTTYKRVATKKEFEQFHENLLQTAKELQAKDLACIFYLRHIDGINMTNIIRTLQKRYKAQISFQKQITGKEPAILLSVVYVQELE